MFGCVILSNKLIPHKLFISVITELQPVLSIDQSICNQIPSFLCLSWFSQYHETQSKHSLIWKNIFWLIKINMCDIFHMTREKITYKYFMPSGHKRGASGGGRWPCQRRSLYVKFRDLGWQVNILNGFPRNKQIFYIKILHFKAWLITNAKICLSH